VNSITKVIKAHPFFIIALTSFAYYALLSSKTLTIVFAGEDAAGWLANGNWWMVAQPMGSPLYVFAQHLVAILPGNQVILATILLSCLPSAISTGLVYSCTYKLTEKKKFGVIAALALMASAIFLSQSTIIEEYALAGMFVTLAVWFKINGKEKSVWLALGLASAVHFLIAIVSLIWFIVDAKEYRRNLRALPIYLACGALPYSYVFILMAMDTPRTAAGSLDWQSLGEYFMGPAGRITGAISIYDFGGRLRDAGIILLTALGIGLIPLAVGLKKGFAHKWLIFCPVVFLLVFWLTSFDRNNWTFLTMCMPIVAIFIGWGLSRMKRSHIAYVTIGTCVLLVTNSFMFNSNMLAQEYPVAQQTMNEIIKLPDRSVVIGITRFSSIALYCNTLGKDVVPLTPGYMDGEDKFDDYITWIHEEYDLEGNNSFLLIENAWEDGRDVYLAKGIKGDPGSKEMERCYILEGSGIVQKVIGFTGYLPYWWDSATTMQDQ